MRRRVRSRLGDLRKALATSSQLVAPEKPCKPKATVIGNALIDYFITKQGDFPMFGGAGVNLAVTLAQYGVGTTLVAPVGSDLAGAALRTRLSNCGVALLSELAPAKTAVAVVHLEGSAPSYTFSELSYPNFGFSTAAIREPSTATDVLIVNAFNYESPSQVNALCRVLRSSAGWRVLDPNVRPGLVRDRGLLVSHFETLLPFADIVKVSDEDLLAMGGDPGPYPVSRILELGTQVVFLTKGEAGGEIFTANGRHYEAPSVAVADVVDSVGAGDAAGGALLVSAIAESGLTGTSQERRDRLSKLNWEAHLEVAMVEASDTCRRRGGPAGAVPPKWKPDPI